MKISKLTRTDEGIISIPSLHDGLFLGVMLIDDGSLELTFKTPGNVRIRIRTTELVAMKCNNFRQGNIVFDVCFYEDIFRARELVARAYGYDKQEAERFLNHRLDEFGPDGGSLIEIRESYGCELVALCRGGLADWEIATNG